MKIQLAVLLVLLCSVAIGVPNAASQSSDWATSNGVLYITDWPATIGSQRSIDSLRVHSEVYPTIDTLTVGYGYRAFESHPILTFAVEWKNGELAFLDGEEIYFEEFNGELLIESLRLRVDVIVHGEPVTHVDFVVDSLMLEAYPGLYSQEVNSLSWDTVFPGIPDSTARSYFETGFELANPTLVSVTFAYFDDESTLARSRGPQVRPRRPSRRTVYGPAIDIYIDFPIFISTRSRAPRATDGTRAREPRGERIGRGGAATDDDRRSSGDRTRRTQPVDVEDQNSSGTRTRTDQGSDEDRRTSSDRTRRTGDAEEDDETVGDILSRGTKKKDEDDDEDDDDDLVPVAIAGAAAVAAVAVAGGTIGYYGNASNTPIGLMAGFAQEEGGFLLQAAINDAVIQRSESREEHFLARVVGFVNVFDSPIQPALGLGLMASELNGDFEYDFSASIGLVGNLGDVILLGGYDVAAGGVDFGIAFNFKAQGKN